MAQLLYLRKQGSEEVVAFKLRDGRLEKETVLSWVGLRSLLIWDNDADCFVAEGFRTDGLSDRVFEPNTKQHPLVVKDEPGGAGPGPSTSAGSQDRETLSTLTAALNQIARLILIRETVQPALAYSLSKITTTRNPGFRSAVLNAYGYSKGECDGSTKTAPCLILDIHVPAASLVVGHIFKHEWAPVSQHVMGIDIDDTGNALPVFKPLEHSFDCLQLCITVDGDVFTVRVLDPDLRKVGLVARAQQLMGTGWKFTVNKELARKTFGDVDGTTIQFYSEHRPLKRCLAFHARQAFCKARQKGWPIDGLAFRDFSSPGYSGDGRAGVESWLASQQMAG